MINLDTLIQKNSPNFSAGRGGKNIELIVMHWIVGRMAAADAEFAKPERQASAHYAVDNGEIHQYVKLEDTAWHAGNFDINQKSIGIEHAGGPTIPITDETYESSAQLVAALRKRFGYLPLRPHRDYKATQCPGTLDLDRIERRAKEILDPPKPPQVDPKDAQIANLTVNLAKAQADISVLDDKITVLTRERNELADQLNVCLGRPPEVREVIKEVNPTWITELVKWLKNLFK